MKTLNKGVSKMNKLTDMQEAGKVHESMQSVVANGYDNYPFEPSVKGDILWTEPLNLQVIADICQLSNDLFNEDGLYIQTYSGEYNWNWVYKNYIPTTDQFLHYLIAWNKKQDRYACNLDLETDSIYILPEEYVSNAEWNWDTPDQTIKTALADAFAETVEIDAQIKEQEEV